MSNTNGGGPNGAPMVKHDGPAKSLSLIGSPEFCAELEPRSLQEAFILAEQFASINYCGVTSSPDAMGRMMTGRSMGLPLTQSMRGLYTVNGRQGIDASLMHGICLGSALCEYFDVVQEECDATKATCVAKRRGRPEQKFVFTIEQAERAGLLERGDEKKTKDSNWTKWREDMLIARCRAITARRVFPDLMFGLYLKEELEAGVDGAPVLPDPNEMQGEIITQPATVQAAKRDYAKEADELIAKAKAAKTRPELAAVRESITSWDGIDPHKERVAKAYNEAKKAQRDSATKDAVPTDGAAQSPLPEGNLFTPQPQEPAKP